MLRFLDAGESHGKGMVAIIEGMPSNIDIDLDAVNIQLFRRQKGYGRGKRMGIERDRIEILSGIRGGKTTGAPIALMLHNRDHDNWKEVMSLDKEYNEKIIVPRPGHADLNGVLKYNYDDIRNVIERASARQTSIRVAIGAICMELLKKFDVKIVSRVLEIGKVKDDTEINEYSESVIDKIEASDVRCLGKEAEIRMKKEIDEAGSNGDTLGGSVEIAAVNLPAGLGSYVSYDKRMDYCIAGSIMSIQGVKAVEIGEGIEASRLYGTKVNDAMRKEEGRVVRETNYAGGIEGGITNGMPLIVKAFMKPIPTTKAGIKTVDLNGDQALSRYERSDVCVVPALGVICEAVLAFEIASAFLEKFGGDSFGDVSNAYNFYIDRIAGW